MSDCQLPSHQNLFVTFWNQHSWDKHLYLILLQLTFCNDPQVYYKLILIPYLLSSLIQYKKPAHGNKHFDVQLSKEIFVHRQIHFPCYIRWWVTWHNCIYICYWCISCILSLALLFAFSFTLTSSMKQSNSANIESPKGSITSSTNMHSMWIIMLTLSSLQSNNIQ